MSLASTRWRLGMLLTALQCVGRPHRRQQCRHLEPRSKRSLGPQRGVPQTWDALAWWLTPHPSGSAETPRPLGAFPGPCISHSLTLWPLLLSPPLERKLPAGKGHVSLVRLLLQPVAWHLALCRAQQFRVE